MNIPSGQNQLPQVELQDAAAVHPKSASAQAQSATAAAPARSAATAAVAKPVERATDVTLRRDTDGRVYYVVSDANSGQEILEVPPKAIRNVDQGIEDYLKGEQSKASSHVEVKA